MASASCHELFPTKLSAVIFVGYILLFVNQGLLVTATQTSDNRYDYNITVVVLLTELLKLLVSAGLYCRQEKSVRKLGQEVCDNWHILLSYFVPALLYCFYNNLSFLNLSNFDPTTYYLLLQFRVVITGVLFQLIFNKTLSGKQWISLCILTMGCMLKQVNLGGSAAKSDAVSSSTKSNRLNFGWDTLLIFVQIVCSCLAGVYNEYLLKRRGKNVDILLQNVFMYLDSIVCNGALLLLFEGDAQEILTTDNLYKALQFRVLLVMINNTAIGIVTSFFLKTLNSILKTFASALELVLTAVFSLIFFQIPIYLNTCLAIGFILAAIFLYSQNPVKNPQQRSDGDDGKRLLDHTEEV